MYRGVWRAYLDRLRRLVRLAGVLGEARMGRELLLALLALLLVRLLLLLHRRHRGGCSGEDDWSWSWSWSWLLSRAAGGVSFLAVAVSQDVVSVPGVVLFPALGVWRSRRKKGGKKLVMSKKSERESEREKREKAARAGSINKRREVT